MCPVLPSPSFFSVYINGSLSFLEKRELQVTATSLIVLLVGIERKNGFKLSLCNPKMSFAGRGWGRR